MAEVATKAAPAVAIAGALVATAPQAQAAVSLSAKTTSLSAKTASLSAKNTTGAERVRTDALVRRNQPATRTYTVRPGDTLSSIAERFYGNPADWTALYHVNSAVVQDPNSIYAGEVLKIPSDPHASVASYTPRHARSTTRTTTTTTLASSTTRLSGTLGCSGLEALWEAAGGSSSEAFIAAEIAMAESGGNQYAVSPTNDYGYWQINGSHGPAMATFNPIGNAKAAIAISDDGHNWDAWTTYTSGAYAGRC